MPGFLASMQPVLAPLFHRYSEHPEGAHKSVGCPSQTVVIPEIMHDLAEVSRTFKLHILTQPFIPVIVTEYKPELRTIIQLVVSPLLHLYAAQLDGAHNNVASPLQIKLFPVMIHPEPALLITVLSQVLMHPFELVVVSE